MRPTTAIAVFGAGNGGQCMAADLALAGHDVVLCELPEFGDALEPVLRTGVLQLTGVGRTGAARLAEVTLDVAAACARCELLNIVVPAFGQRRFFDALLPHLRDGQAVVVWSGDFGSLELRELLRHGRPGLAVHLVETNTLPYGTRLLGAGRPDLQLAAPTVLAATLPGDSASPTLLPLRELWPCIAPAADVLSVALSNPNPIVHPPGSLLNVGRIEYSRGDFNMYREGITEAVARVIRYVYGEVQAVANALGAQILEYEERDFRTTVSIMGVAFQAPFDTAGVIGAIAGPTSIHDRYITEDLPYGLVPIAQLGERCGVPTPLIDAIVTLGSHVCGRDFWSEGRTLRRLGLADLSPAEILASVGQPRPRPAALEHADAGSLSRKMSTPRA
jgi:opine dehydrogenase